MDTNLYPAAPVGIAPEKLAISAEFRKKVTAVAGSIFLFFIVYLLLVIAAIGLAIACCYFGLMLIIALPRFLTIIKGHQLRLRRRKTFQRRHSGRHRDTDNRYRRGEVAPLRTGQGGVPLLFIRVGRHRYYVDGQFQNNELGELRGLAVQAAEHLNSRKFSAYRRLLEEQLAALPAGVA